MTDWPIFFHRIHWSEPRRSVGVARSSQRRPATSEANRGEANGAELLRLRRASGQTDPSNPMDASHRLQSASLPAHHQRTLISYHGTSRLRKTSVVTGPAGPMSSAGERPSRRMSVATRPAPRAGPGRLVPAVPPRDGNWTNLPPPLHPSIHIVTLRFASWFLFFIGTNCFAGQFAVVIRVVKVFGEAKWCVLCHLDSS